MSQKYQPTGGYKGPIYHTPHGTAPREVCFKCGKRTAMVPKHGVGECCHGLSGHCKQCGFQQGTRA